MGELIFINLFKISCRDNTGGQGNDCNAEYGGNHGYNSADGGNGIDVAVTHGGKRNGCPINCIEKGIEGFGLNVINNQGGNYYVCNRKRSHGG